MTILRPAFLLSAALLAGCTKGADSTSNATPAAGNTTVSVTGAYEKAFREGFTRKFAESCAQAAIAKGAPAEKITPACQCAADELGAKYSVGQLMALTEEQATPVLRACAEKLGMTPH